MSNNTLCLARVLRRSRGKNDKGPAADSQRRVNRCQLRTSEEPGIGGSMGSDTLPARSIFSSLVALQIRSCAPATNESDQNATALCLAL